MSDKDRILFDKQIEVRWADCDANQHMRHTAYSDLCAHTRIAFLNSIGLTQAWSQEHRIGPVLFKEETEYQQEAHMGDELRVTVEAGEPTGFSKSIRMLQYLYSADGHIAAVHRCVIGWMDLDKRKIVTIPIPILERFPIDVDA